MTLELFPSLPVACRRPTEPIARDALVEKGCRYWLKRAWGAGPLIAWVMCNPSNADAKRDDPTMWRVMSFSHTWGFGSCVVVNVIPFISSTPAAAFAWAKRSTNYDFNERPPERDQWISNIYHGEQQLRAAQAHIVAWGNDVDQTHAKQWLQDIADAGDCTYSDDEEEEKPVEWLCLGTTASGAPKHPLARGIHRVPDDFKAVKWRS